MTYPSFNTGDILTAADMNAVGFWKIGATTVTNQTNIDVSSCFSSDFAMYRVVISATSTHTTGTNLRMRLFTGTSTPETGAVYDRWGFSWTSSATNEVNANQTSLYIGDLNNGANTRTVCAFDIFNPNVAIETHILPYAWGSASGAVFFMAGRIETSTQYTGLRLYADAGNLTGSVRVYGYQN